MASKSKAYTKAINNVYEYLDIKNIIKRLQDVDKLKLILLNDEQRHLFELISRPGVTGHKSSRETNKNASSVMLESISERKISKILNKDRRVIKMPVDSDNISQKIIQLLDKGLLLEMRKNTENLNFINSKSQCKDEEFMIDNSNAVFYKKKVYLILQN